MIQITYAQNPIPNYLDTTSFQIAQKLSWLLWMPSVVVFDVSSPNRIDRNKIDMIVVDSQGRDAIITISKVAADKAELHQGDDLRVTRYNTGSMLSKNQKPVIYLLNPPV